MPTLSALRASPHFAPLFAHVHVLCWWILRWQINRFHRWCRREGITDALYSVNRRGFLKIVRLGDKHDPAAYRAPVRTFRSLTDFAYASDLPACLDVSFFSAAISNALILPCACGGGGILHSRMTEGVLAPHPNTS